MQFKQLFLIILPCLMSLSSFQLAAETRYSLLQAIDYALDNNPDLQIMQDRIGQAQAQVGEAMANFYPQITSRLSYQHSDNPSRAFGMIISQRRLNLTGTDFNHPGGTDNYRPEITARYALFRGGQDSHRLNAAESGVEAAQQDRAAMRNQLVQAVSATFYTYLAAFEQHKVSQRTIAAVSSELKQSQARYEAGSELKSDVLSLQVQLAEAKDAQIRTGNALELTLTGLKTLMGLDAGQALLIDLSDDIALPNAAQDFNQLLDAAIAQRPEMLAVNTRLEMAKSQLDAAQGAYLPRADAFVSYGSDSKNLDFSTHRDNVTAGVSVELDIFNGFRTSEKVKQAEYALAMAEKSIRQTRLHIENEVNSAWLKQQEALARLDVTRASVAAAEEALRMVKEQRKAGTVTVTRYIEAELARDKAYVRRISAKFDALRAQAQLNQAIGIWK